jgi:hypothetical protein
MGVAPASNSLIGPRHVHLDSWLFVAGTGAPTIWRGLLATAGQAGHVAVDLFSYCSRRGFSSWSGNGVATAAGSWTGDEHERACRVFLPADGNSRDPDCHRSACAYLDRRSPDKVDSSGTVHRRRSCNMVFQRDGGPVDRSVLFSGVRLRLDNSGNACTCSGEDSGHFDFGDFKEAAQNIGIELRAAACIETADRFFVIEPFAVAAI